MKINYTNPRKRQGIFIWEIEANFLPKDQVGGAIFSSNERVMDKVRSLYGGDAVAYPTLGRENSFMVWMSEIKEWESQKAVVVNTEGPKSKSYEDKENGNTVSFFDFSNNYFGKKQVRINFTLDTYETEVNDNNVPFPDYDRYSNLHRRYTKSTKQVAQTDEVKKLSESIVASKGDYISKAKALFDWIQGNISIVAREEVFGITRTFTAREGGVKDVNFLYLAMLRAAGIPARVVSGVYGEGGRKQEFHLWVEFYIEEVGWIPVDCSKKMFAHVDNNRVIFSKGEGVVLERAPLSSEAFAIDSKKFFLLGPEAIYLDYKEQGFIVVRKNKYLLIKE